jgi:VCBS repeat-containing protein
MGLSFENNFESGVTQAYKDTVTLVENFFTSQLTTSENVVLKIDWRYDTVDGNGNPFPSNALANNIFGNNLHSHSYSDIVAALKTHAANNDSNPGDDTAFLNALPASDPGVNSDPGTNTVQWWLTRGQEKLLGLVSGTDGNAASDPDTKVTLNSAFNFDFDRSDGISAGSTDAFGVIAHELSEVSMGRFMFGGAPFLDSHGNPDQTNNYSLMDLLHFVSAANGAPGRAIFETGSNNILSFTGSQGDPNFNLVLDNSGDIADPNTGASPRNSFADANSGVFNNITQTDLRDLDALGWNRVNGLDDYSQDTSTSGVLNDDVNGLSGNIELQGDHDWFKVTLDSSKHYVIELEGASSGNGTLADPFLALYGGPSHPNPSRDTTVAWGDGTPSSLVTTNNDGGVGTDSKLSIGLGQGGTYYVDAGSFNASLGVQDVGQGTYKVVLIGNTPPVLNPDGGSPHGLTELPNTSNSSTPDTVSGSMSFTDPDTTDTHTASASVHPGSESWSGGSPIPTATQTDLSGALSAGISLDSTNGTLSWQFSLPDQDVDFLAVGEKLTVTYDVTLTDHRVGSPLSDSSTQQVTVVFTGTNDVPVVVGGSSTLTGSVNELPNTTGSSAIDSTTGTVAFSDPDLNDRPTPDAIDSSTQTVTWKDATHDYTSELTPAQIAEFKAAFTIAAEAANKNAGNVDWNFQVVDKDLDFLAVGEKLTITTPVTIDDHHGGTVTQDVVVTVIGANDNPVAIPDSNGVGKGSTLTVPAGTGVLANDFDPDVHDNGHLSVSAVNGVAGNVGHAVTGTYGSLTVNADGSYVYAANHGSLPAKIVAQDIFQYTVSDTHGGTDTASIYVVVSNPGTNYISGINTVLNGGNGPDVVDGFAGGDTVNGGNGPDVLIGGAGDQLTGGNGPDIFLFRPHFGANTITDFDTHNDSIQFDASLFTSAADILAHHATDTAGGVVIDDGHGDTVTLAGVHLSQLSAGMFLLA